MVEIQFQKTDRRRSKAHLRFVAGEPCCGGRWGRCQTAEHQAHHLTIAPGQPKARGLKTGDQWTLSLCPEHHHELHMRGDERAWWLDRGINPVAIARRLWNQSIEEGRVKP